MFDLRPYQEPIAQKVFDYMSKNKGKHPLVACPTGSGKTVIASDIIEKALRKWPKTHILVISHVQEILDQDYKSISFHTKRDVGLYSAGLGKRQIHQITVAGIQSIYRTPELFKAYKLIIIDECHLIPPGKNTMYRKFFAGLDNPRYLGLTATPFRLGSGYIYGEEDSLFHDLVYDLTEMHKFNKLIADGYLCNLKTQATDIELDTDNIHMMGGDFDKKEMSKQFDVKHITNKAVQEIITKGKDYKKWLIFAIDIEHAEHIAEELSKNGIPTMVIHSKMEFDRRVVIDSYKSGIFKCMVNVNVLTTGFDDPEIDLIALLRPTKSPVVHVQTIGRGLRIAPNKDHCLILDFAGNTERLGPINDVHVRKPGKAKKGGDPITKKCPECNTVHHPSVKICDYCGYKFEFKTALTAHSGSLEVIAKKTNGWFKVSDVVYSLHEKANSPDMVKVTYQCGLRQFKEYVCIEHKGYAGHKARHWAQYRGVEAESAAQLIKDSQDLKSPNRIQVDTHNKYPVITDFSF